MPVSGLPPYDDANIFARILRGEIPSTKVYDDEWAYAFKDINPQAPVHVLIIPRGKYCSFADFTAEGSDAEIEEPGYRILANMGEHGGQEVPHFHVHLFAGRSLGRMVPRE
jgi:histidine triad (HIT) family protein